MLKWLAKIQPAVLFAFCLLLVFHNIPAARSETGVSYEISDIKMANSDNTLTYNIFGTSPPVYTVVERFSPFRVIIDIAGAFFAKTISPAATKIAENNFSELTVSDLKAQDPPVMRFEFTLADSHDYKVAVNGNNLEIKLLPTSSKNVPAASSAPHRMLTLKDFRVTSTPNSTTITILASESIEKFKVETIASGTNKTPRMYIDIQDVKINELAKEKQIGTSVSKIRVAPQKGITRIVFDSATPELFKYTVNPSPEGLTVVIDESYRLGKSSGTTAKSPAPSANSDSTLDSLISSSEKLVVHAPSKNNTVSTSADKVSAIEKDFNFSGYKNQRISIDFYKIDIHNVFRLFRQISDLNIIVDEGVTGTLTLALNDVPWDFALDIILNLMDLKKEERFNTIVIYPSKKDFVWPTRTDDKLSIKADLELIEQESLVVEQIENVSVEVNKSKELILKARELEGKEKFEEAATVYADALKLWPDNENISNRLATLYLVNLGMNAKAVHYAKESLKHNPKNSQAALYAAIGSANMQRTSEASEYFAQSISQSPPMREALVSYAAFSENIGKNEEAIKLLEKYHSHYGETLDTMVAKARLLDKLNLFKEGTLQYKAILASGFQIRPDLRKFIEGRITAKNF